jgi:hypothetical protein
MSPGNHIGYDNAKKPVNQRAAGFLRVLGSIFDRVINTNLPGKYDSKFLTSVHDKNVT